MRIVSTPSNDDIIVGLHAAITAICPDLRIWTPQQKPAFDMFDEINPDILFCDVRELGHIVEAKKEYVNTKLVVFGIGTPNYIEPDLIIYPSNMDDKIVSMVHTKKCPYIILERAANLAMFNKGVAKPEYSSDVLYWSDQTVNELLKPLTSIVHDFNLKIVGPTPLPMAQYLGNANLKTMSDVVVSTKVGLDYNCRHKYDYHANKIPCVDLLGSSTLIEQIEKCIKNKKYRKQTINDNYNNVISKDTYFHRLSDILSALELPEISQPLEVMRNFLND